MSSSSSSDYGALKQVMTEDSVAAFVRRLAQQEIEFADFKSHFTQLSNVKTQNERLLKSKVLTNYTYFIETAKEIKRLDNETKNIGDLLSDQSRMLADLNKALSQVAKSDLFNTKFQSSANSVNSRLNSEVSGLNLPNNDTRALISENVVDEIDLHTARPRQKLCVFVLSDGMLTTRFSPAKNVFSSTKLICVEFYLFNSISIEQTGASVIKAIVYPEPVILQFDSAAELKDWIEMFNQAKKRAQMNQGALGRRRSSADTDLSSDIQSRHSANVSDLFIYDIPAHLDVAIALKDYDACLKYLSEADAFFRDNESLLEGSSTNIYAQSSPSLVAKVRDSIEEKRKLLISTLREELSVEGPATSDPSSSDGQATRLVNMPGSFGKRIGQLKAASALVKLNYTNEACHLFLKATSLNLRRILSQKLLLSIESLSSIATFLFNSLNLAAKDFQQMFSGHPTMFSCLSVWACDEVTFFCEQIGQHFRRNNLLLDLSKLSMLVEAVMDESSALLEETGMELALFLERGIEPLIEKCTEKILNLVKQTLQDKSEVEANWDCVKFEGTESERSEQMTVFLKSMEDIGIDLISLFTDDTVAICHVSVSYFRLLVPICQDLGAISKFGNQSIPVDALHDLVALYIDLLAVKLGNLDDPSGENYEYEKNLLLLQLEFFRDAVLKILIEKFEYHSQGLEIAFDYEVERITIVCSTLTDSNSQEDIQDQQAEDYYDRRLKDRSHQSDA